LVKLDQAAIDAACSAPMLSQVETWCAVNSGSYNMIGLKTMQGLFADAFSDLPGTLVMVDPDLVERVDASGSIQSVEHGQHLHLRVRPDAPIPLLFTGHMDTVFPIDHPFQSLTWREPGILNGLALPT
jgi:glutamate carboxypeptidase